MPNQIKNCNKKIKIDLDDFRNNGLVCFLCLNGISTFED